MQCAHSGHRRECDCVHMMHATHTTHSALEAFTISCVHVFMYVHTVGPVYINHCNLPVPNYLIILPVPNYLIILVCVQLTWLAACGHVHGT